MAGPWFPGLLKHAGASWSQLVNHQYLTIPAMIRVGYRREFAAAVEAASYFFGVLVAAGVATA
ncbi:MAG: hypothetical protein RLZZ584_1019 [Pseudomonadota bacterium]|jgi:TRAP-type uncharacterized transport system fused permease subunit